MAGEKRSRAATRLVVVALSIAPLLLASAATPARADGAPTISNVTVFAYQGGEQIEVDATLGQTTADTGYHVEYGEGPTLDQSTPEQGEQAAATYPISVRFPAAVGHTYYFRLVASNAHGRTTTLTGAFFFGGSQPRTTLVVAPGLGGTVTSTPSGINCLVVCTASFTGGSTVTLHAAPRSGYSFAGWRGLCSGSSPDCTVTLPASQSPSNVSASFSQIGAMRTLTVITDGLGTGTVWADASNNPGHPLSCVASPAHSPCTWTFFSPSVPVVVTLTASPSTDSAFAGWGGACSGAAGCSVTVANAATVNASFAALPVTVTVSTAGTGQGTISSDPAGISCGTTCSATFPGAVPLTLRAIAEPGSAFLNWTGICQGTAPTCTISPKTAATVGATFVHLPMLAVTASGSGHGSITSTPAGIDCGATCVAPFTAGIPVTLHAAAAEGSGFAGWNGACSGATADCTVALTADATVSATFTTLPTLVVTTTGRGSVTSSPAGIDCGTTCSATFPLDTHATLRATPTLGWRFARWSGACALTRRSVCALHLTDAATVGAVFEVIPPPCVVPKLQGKTLAAARATLAAAHCTLGAVVKIPAGAFLVGRVVGQSPRAGRRLAHGARVGVRVGARRS